MPKNIVFSLRGTGAWEEAHVFGLSRLAHVVAAGLGRPTLGFLHTWTSHQRAVEAAEYSSVSCAPCLAFLLASGADFPIESTEWKDWTGWATEPRRAIELTIGEAESRMEA